MSSKRQGFNSILVRLKALMHINAVAVDCLFQFHTGSIKSWHEPRSHVPRRFQFHTGSIKSLRLLKRLEIAKKGFNSILVRLKVRPAHC